MRIMFNPLKISIRCLAVMLVSIWISGAAYAQGGDPNHGAKQLWQLIDYLAVDYGGAVEHGKVVSDGEYAEMLDFSDNAVKQIAALPAHPTKPAVSAAIADLRAAVVGKADATEVKRLAHHANALLIAAYPIPVAPKALPNLARGAAIYSAQCAACHGATGGGDGALAATLDPKPIAFTDAQRAQSRSVMALFKAFQGPRCQASARCPKPIAGTWRFSSVACRMTMPPVRAAKNYGKTMPESGVCFQTWRP
jgi:high-affinity iron transporter